MAARRGGPAGHQRRPLQHHCGACLRQTRMYPQAASAIEQVAVFVYAECRLAVIDADPPTGCGTTSARPGSRPGTPCADCTYPPQAPPMAVTDEGPVVLYELPARADDRTRHAAARDVADRRDHGRRGYRSPDRRRPVEALLAESPRPSMAADFSRIHGTCLALNREALAVTPRESGGRHPDRRRREVGEHVQPDPRPRRTSPTICLPHED